eukprot:GHVL01019637.1.p1 GENE.GHVL01019637.1~~GHVL01019637.1.p1  ORF type:complete len:349 (+),score=53.11 GHVL01019637.1:19-1065(+)
MNDSLDISSRDVLILKKILSDRELVNSALQHVEGRPSNPEPMPEENVFVLKTFFIINIFLYWFAITCSAIRFSFDNQDSPSLICSSFFILPLTFLHLAEYYICIRLTSNLNLTCYYLGIMSRIIIWIDIIFLLISYKKSLIFYISLYISIFSIGIFVIVIQLRSLLSLCIENDHFSFTEPQYFFKPFLCPFKTVSCKFLWRRLTNVGLVDNRTPVCSFQTPQINEDGSLHLEVSVPKLTRSDPCVMQLTQVAQLSDLWLLQSALQQTYLRQQDWDAVEHSMALPALSRCFCQDLIQCALKACFLLSTGWNLFLFFCMFLNMTQCLLSCIYNSVEADDDEETMEEWLQI